MSERGGLFRMQGYSWRCSECGDYGGDWVARATATAMVSRCKRDAQEEYRDHQQWCGKQRVR